MQVEFRVFEYLVIVGDVLELILVLDNLHIIHETIRNLLNLWTDNEEVITFFRAMLGFDVLCQLQPALTTLDLDNAQFLHVFRHFLRRTLH